MRESLVISQKVRTFAPVLKMVVIHSVRANGNRSLGKNAKVSLFYGQPDAHRCMPSVPVITAAIQKDFGALRGTAIFRTTGCAAVPLSNRLLGVDRVMKQEQEIWKDIDGYEGKYQVSNLGRVRSFRIKSEGVILAQRQNADGYYMAKICGRSVSVHRLVAKAFVNGYREGLQVNHKNENKIDNCADNLEWVTFKENINHGTRNKRAAGNISKAISVAVCQYDADNRLVAIYTSQAEAERVTGISSRQISAVCCGHRKSTGGYKWAYKYPYRRKKAAGRCYELPHKEYDTTSLDGEQWVDIAGYNGLYQVSNLGRVKSIDRTDDVFCAGRIMKPRIVYRNGRLVEICITLTVNRNRRKISVCRLVADVFCKGYKKGLVLNHINGDITDNRADNLEWVTVSRMYEIGRYRANSASIAKRRAVIQMTTDGKVVAEYESLIAAEKAVGVAHSNIRSVCLGKKLTCGGYKWKFKNDKK